MQLSISDLRELIGGGTAAVSHGLEIGKSYIVRSATFFYVGRLESVNDSFVVLDDASTVFDTGQWHTALETGQLAEVECSPVPVHVARGGIVDLHEWMHVLPRESK